MVFLFVHHFDKLFDLIQFLLFLYLYLLCIYFDINIKVISLQRPIPVFTNIQHKLFEKIHPDMKRITYTLTLYPKFVGTLFLRAQRFVEAYCKSTI